MKSGPVLLSCINRALHEDRGAEAARGPVAPSDGGGEHPGHCEGVVHY